MGSSTIQQTPAEFISIEHSYAVRVLKAGEEDCSNWEGKLYEAAPSARHRLLALQVSEIINTVNMRIKWCNDCETAPYARKLGANYGSHLEDDVAVWLHNALMAHLPKGHLEIYEDLFIQMRDAMPDSMLPLPDDASATNSTQSDLLKKLKDYRVTPEIPLLLITPTTCDFKRWKKALSPFFVVPQKEQPRAASSLLVEDWITKQFKTCKTILRNASTDHVLVGIGAVGATLAISLVTTVATKVSALVCVGAPAKLLNMNDLQNITIPTLFILPQNGAKCNVPDMEEVRKRMKKHANILVVGSVNDQLKPIPGVDGPGNISTNMNDLAVAREIHQFAGTPNKERKRRRNLNGTGSVATGKPTPSIKILKVEKVVVLQQRNPNVAGLTQQGYSTESQSLSQPRTKRSNVIIGTPSTLRIYPRPRGVP